jgi:pimeloyl-ACP methyl ester carboxylesterase
VRRLLKFFGWLSAGGLALLLAYVGGSIAWLDAHETQDAMAVAPAGGRLTAGAGAAVFSQAHGAAGRPVVLLVHGTAAWSGTWFSLVPALEREGYRVVAVDLPPFGFSDKAVGTDFSRPAQAERLRAVLDAEGATQATVVGHSFGGGPALEFALRWPERVQRLVLVDAALGLDAPAPDPKVPACRVLAAPALRDPLIAATAANPLWSRTLLRSFVARQEAVTPERLREYRRPALVRNAHRALGAWAYHFACEAETGLSTQAPAIARLAVPLDLLWGTDDTITPLAQAQHLRMLVPGARLQAIAGVGHIPHIEDPAAFERVLLATLKQPHISR